MKTLLRVTKCVKTVYHRTQTCKNDTVNLGWSKSLFHVMKNYKEEVSFRTRVVGNLVLVLANVSKTLIID